ncbi:hypothetical protein CAPTEDRAFT_213804 [Capitella teleta]|uniref:Uncharacterized protein n=1 Tax=Capitella teleta TaxID=283909 RepID=R7U8F4_CAPTE|nr:hypothetical protein CAPTEDRAFT_213804 [Capitella teleta]|eukprot:ELU02264.1 hypothetical protein CAPTEDRAFT_213804 [Capitella teleta]
MLVLHVSRVVITDRFYCIANFPYALAVAHGPVRKSKLLPKAAFGCDQGPPQYLCFSGDGAAPHCFASAPHSALCSAPEFGVPPKWNRCLKPGDTSFNSNRDAASQVSCLDLVALQVFTGAWILNEALASQMGCSLAECNPPQGAESSVWATILALLVLNTKYAENKTECKMIEGKAEGWLQAQNVPQLQDLREKAKIVLDLN